MNTNDVIKFAIAAFIGAIVIISIVAPTIYTGTAPTLNYTNEGIPYAAPDEETHTIVFSADGITTDGADVDVSVLDSAYLGYYTVVYGDSQFIRIQPSANALRVVAGSSMYNFSYAEKDVTITISGTTATVSQEGQTSRDITNVIAYISTTGDYVLSKNPYVNEDSEIYGAGHTGFTVGLTVYTVWAGDMGAVSGAVVAYVPSSTFNSVTITSTNVNTTDKNNGLYQVDSVIVNYSIVDSSDVETETFSTYTVFLAPALVEYDNPNYIDSTVTTIAQMLPVLMLVGVMLFVVGSFITNRRA